MRTAFVLPLLLGSVFAPGVSAQEELPSLGFRVAPDWPRMPQGMNFMETAGVAVDPSNHVYVIHRGPHPIMEFDADGGFVRAWGDGMYDRAHSIRIDAQGNIWTADDGSHTVLKMDRHGRVQMVLGRWRSSSDVVSTMPDGSAGGALRGSRDDGVARFNRPTDVAFATNGDIFVADGYGNSRVMKFDKDGKFLKTWGERGSAPGQFHTPHSILVDKQNHVYVADRENYRVQIFDTEGKFLKQWKGLGAPWGLDFTPDGNIAMADGYNNRVLKLTLEGKVIGAFGSMGTKPGQFHFAHQIAAGPDGSIYTAEILNWRPQKFVLR